MSDTPNFTAVTTLPPQKAPCWFHVFFPFFPTPPPPPQATTLSFIPSFVCVLTKWVLSAGFEFAEMVLGIYVSCPLTFAHCTLGLMSVRVAVHNPNPWL